MQLALFFLAKTCCLGYLDILFLHLVVGKVQSINSCQIQMAVISANIVYTINPMRKVDSAN